MKHSPIIYFGTYHVNYESYTCINYSIMEFIYDGVYVNIYFSDRKSNISLEKQEQYYNIDGDVVHHPIV